MRAFVCERYSDHQDLVAREVPIPQATSGQLVVEVAAIGIGFPEMLTLQGKYQFKPKLPFIPGAEISGVVRESTHSELIVGTKVMGHVRLGAYAEFVAADSALFLPLPKKFSFAQGATYLTAYRTAHVALVVRGGLVQGETLLVHGAAGGVGLAAVQLGKALGATVIATASSAAKLAAAKDRGADHCLCVTATDGRFRDAVKELTDGQGANVIFDPVGGDVFDESMRCIAPFGRLLVIGFASGRIPQASVNYALIKQISIVGVRAGEYGRLNPVGGAAVNEALLEYADTGAVQPAIYREFPFEALPQAFEDIAKRRVIGRNVVARLDDA
ncbi:MAG: NADPH:quinone oxidoreductase family protein [Pseudomonadota bacterium]